MDTDRRFRVGEKVYVAGYGYARVVDKPSDEKLAVVLDCDPDDRITDVPLDRVTVARI